MTSKYSRSAFLEETAEIIGYNTDDMCKTCQGLHKSEKCPHPAQTAVKPTKAHRQKVIDELNEELQPPKSPLSRRQEGHLREREEQRQLRHEAEARARAERAEREEREQSARISEQLRLQYEEVRKRMVEREIKEAMGTRLEDPLPSDTDDLDLEEALITDEDTDEDVDDEAESRATAGSSKQGDKDKRKDRVTDRGRKVAFASGSGKPRSKR